MNARTEQPQVLERDAPKQLPVQTDANALLAAITAAASNKDVDVNKVERLFAIHQTVVKQQAEAAFNDAMARAQAEIQPVVNNAVNTHTRSSYAKLSEIDKAITPIHTKFGLSISYDTETKNEADPVPTDMLRIVAIVSHSGGHSRRYHIDLPPDVAGAQGTTNKTKLQGLGSTNSYGRRYLKLMIFNVSTMDDNDGNGAGGAKKDAGQPQGRAAEEKKFYPDDKFIKALPEWKELMAKGKKTADQIIATVGAKHPLSEDQIRKIRAAAGDKK